MCSNRCLFGGCGNKYRGYAILGLLGCLIVGGICMGLYAWYESSNRRYTQGVCRVIDYKIKSVYCSDDDDRKRDTCYDGYIILEIEDVKDKCPGWEYRKYVVQRDWRSSTKRYLERWYPLNTTYVCFYYTTRPYYRVMWRLYRHEIPFAIGAFALCCAGMIGVGLILFEAYYTAKRGVGYLRYQRLVYTSNRRPWCKQCRQTKIERGKEYCDECEKYVNGVNQFLKDSQNPGFNRWFSRQTADMCLEDDNKFEFV